MDVEDYKKYAIPKIEAGKMVKVVRQAIKSVQNIELDQDEKQKDLYMKKIKIQQELEEQEQKEQQEQQEQKEEEQAALLGPQLAALTAQQLDIADLEADFTDFDKETLLVNNIPLPVTLYLNNSTKDEITEVIKDARRVKKNLENRKKSKKK